MTEIQVFKPGATATRLTVEAVPRIGEMVVLEDESFTVAHVVHFYGTGGRRGGTQVQHIHVLLVVS